MAENTPEEGAFSRSDSGLESTTAPTRKRTTTTTREGEYGVLSWWDYGHWITTIGERIPNANPFQQRNTNGS